MWKKMIIIAELAEQACAGEIGERLARIDQFAFEADIHPFSNKYKYIRIFFLYSLAADRTNYRYNFSKVKYNSC